MDVIRSQIVGSLQTTRRSGAPSAAKAQKIVDKGFTSCLIVTVQSQIIKSKATASAKQLSDSDKHRLGGAGLISEERRLKPGESK